MIGDVGITRPLRVKVWCALATAACIGAVLASCSRAEEPDVAPLVAAEISGARLWQRIAEEADYKSYAEHPGHEGIRPGQSPHGRFHIVYINKLLADALPLPDRRAPVGTIIVKENLTAEKELDALTVMVKVEGYDPAHNDWFWAKFAPDGTVQAEGSPGGCIKCHEGMVHNDYVIIRRLDE